MHLKSLVSNTSYVTSTHTGRSRQGHSGTEWRLGAHEVPTGHALACTQAAPQLKQEPNDLTFDIRGIDPAVANALRRILIAEARTLLC